MGIDLPTVYSTPSMGRPLNWTFCSRRKLDISSSEEKLISLDTCWHLRIYLGTLAGGGR